MKSLKIFIITLILLAVNILNAQSKRTAKRYFKELAYKKAADAYTNIYERGNDSYEIISRVADAYYFNSDTENAEKWYTTLSEKYPKEITQKHLFRYAHSLKGNKKYDKANSVIKQVNTVDNAQELLNNPDYYVDYKNHKYKVTSFDNLSVNTKYSDFGAYVFKDQLYFASTKPVEGSEEIYKWNEQPFLNLYRGNINNAKKGTTNEAIDVKSSTTYKPIKTKYHESNAVITKDGNTMYFTRDNFYKGKKRTSSSKDGIKRMNLKLYRATLRDGEWSDVYELPFNSDEFSNGHPTLSTDEKTLYYVSDKPGGFGETDIYKVSISKDDNSNITYGEPTNLGKTINTKGKEMFPFISDDNTLYFSSNGHLGLGGLDVFESLLFENGTFGKVENLQTPFNSPVDDFSFYIDIENKRGFVSSNREGGKGDDDIYSFVLERPKVRPDYDCKKTLNGIVTNLKTGEILPGATVGIYDSEGKLVNQTTADSKGAFSYKVNCRSEFYKLKGSKQDFRDDIEQVQSEKFSSSDIIKLELEPLIIAQPVAAATPAVPQIVIRPIYFNFDKAGIREDSEYELEHVVDVMKSHPEMVIKIESHTDSRGSYAYNKRLSQRRADSTKRYLISRGLSASRISSAIGYGESQLLNNCNDANKNKCTEEEHQLNRRSYFIIVKGGNNVSVDNVGPKVIDRMPGR